jgi:hypothetical protein
MALSRPLGCIAGSRDVAYHPRHVAPQPPWHQLDRDRPLNDGTAITVAFGFGIYLALAAIGSALWAQRRDEDNLWLSAGFMCGSCALVHADYAWDMAAMFAGAAAMLLLRSRTRTLSPR